MARAGWRVRVLATNLDFRLHPQIRALRSPMSQMVPADGLSCTDSRFVDRRLKTGNGDDDLLAWLQRDTAARRSGPVVAERKRGLVPAEVYPAA